MQSWALADYYVSATSGLSGVTSGLSGVTSGLCGVTSGKNYELQCRIVDPFQYQNSIFTAILPLSFTYMGSLQWLHRSEKYFTVFHFVHYLNINKG
jgi:hypothetical protein